MDWNDVRHFLALARLGSVRAAGASLGVSHSTVARRVESLEAELSTRLFDRNRDGYTLTEAGRQMLPGAERIETEMASLERGLLGQDERLAGNVALTCCDNYVGEVLLRELTPLCAEYPDIELSFTTDSRAFDLSKREADIAVRILGAGSQPPEHLLGTRLAPVTVCNDVAREHASRLDPGLGGTEARWVCFEDRKLHEAMIAGTSFPDVPSWGGFSSLELIVQAAREGLGFVMLPTYVGEVEPALQRLSKHDLRRVADLWMLSHLDLRDNVRFRTTRARIVQAMRKHGWLFRGERCPTAGTERPKLTPHAR